MTDRLFYIFYQAYKGTGTRKKHWFNWSQGRKKNAQQALFVVLFLHSFSIVVISAAIFTRYLKMSNLVDVSTVGVYIITAIIFLSLWLGLNTFIKKRYSYDKIDSLEMQYNVMSVRQARVIAFIVVLVTLVLVNAYWWLLR
jgi:hypothetical protein